MFNKKRKTQRKGGDQLGISILDRTSISKREFIVKSLNSSLHQFMTNARMEARLRSYLLVTFIVR